jgi:hypothetical protein
VLYQSKPDDLQFSITNTENFDRLKIVESNSVQAWYYRNQWPIAIGALSLATVGVFGLLVAAGLRKQEDAIPAGHKRALNRPTGGSSRVSRKPGSGGKRYGRRRKSKP